VLRKNLDEFSNQALFQDVFLGTLDFAQTPFNAFDYILRHNWLSDP
jgi:hypothetical protein